MNCFKPYIIETKEEVILKNISLRSRSFNVKTEKITDDSIFNWESAYFEIPDSIPFGPVKLANIKYAIDSNRIYLKAIKKIEKSEFEQIFGFRCGEFIPNRIISSPLSSFNI
jgi:hypothetical protein